jgi:uncharacterized protein YecT (DUF1311 family)
MITQVSRLVILIIGTSVLQSQPLTLARGAEMQVEAAIADANLEIGTVYKKLMARLSAEQQIKLRDEQRKWIKWRDQEAARIATHGGAAVGSAYREDFANAQLQLIRQRTEVLRGLLKQ